MIVYLASRKRDEANTARTNRGMNNDLANTNNGRPGGRPPRRTVYEENVASYAFLALSSGFVAAVDVVLENGSGAVVVRVNVSYSMKTVAP